MLPWFSGVEHGLLSDEMESTLGLAKGLFPPPPPAGFVLGDSFWGSGNLDMLRV